MYKKILALLIACSFLLISISIAFADGQITDPQKVKGTMNRVFQCPTGWHKISNTYTCVPDKPAPVWCPPDHLYFERLSCPSGESCNTGCQVGCFKPPS